MFVAEAALSALFEQLFAKLLSSEVSNFARGRKVNATLEEWRRTLLAIDAVLSDAEERQTREKAVKMWLDDLRALAFRMEDVLDEFDTEAKRSLIEEPQTSRSKITKVRNLIPTPYITRGIFYGQINKKMKIVSKELDTIAKRKSNLHLREGVGGVPFATEERLQTTSMVDESFIYGRGADKEKIIELLLSVEATKDNRVTVISIVGMGGVGKTTLAQIIYNDVRVESNFAIKGWACVSNQFNVGRITKAILESITNRSYDFNNLELLQHSLKTEMNGKRFFLVLDEVWNENPNYWDVLQVPFGVAAPGSIIIVTTRNQNVASIMSTTSSYHLGELPYEECWLLFAQQAFTSVNSNIQQEMEIIGREIVRKCKGLPLAVKTLGGLLRSKRDSNAWNEVLNNEIWAIPPEQSNILPALYLSYHYLSTKLKLCFAFCCIFPKDYEFERKTLVLLWMAAGLLDGSRKEDAIENVGDLCFDELFSRSFFQQSSNHESLYVMHDLIHDLAQFVSGEFCFLLEVGKQNKISNQTQHFSYIAESYDLLQKFNPLQEAYNLRTFLPLWRPYQYGANGRLSQKVLHLLLPTLRCLRILSLSNYCIADLPDSIGGLKHLRFLDLSHTPIRRLPKSVTTLFNLQTLILSNCKYLIDLPRKLEKLINLRHLDISGTELKGMPTNLNMLKNLRRLTTFIAGDGTGARVRELKDLSHLAGTLSIFKLQNVEHAMDAVEADLKGKGCLDELVLEWDANATDGDLEKETSLLEKLQPHTNLKQLTVQSYPGKKFPDWLGEPSFTNMGFLKLDSCKNCSSLPPLGQLPSLKKLWIGRINGIKRVGFEFYGNGPSSFKPFGSLETLMFQQMLGWEEWSSFAIEGAEFPCLQELHISRCPKLRADLPKHLPLLRDLVISECQQLLTSLPMLHLTSITELAASDICSTSTHISTAWSKPVELQHMHSLILLTLYDCPQLKELPPVLHKLTSLKHLEIKRCPSLLSFLEMALPPMLETLRIESCNILESLPDGMMLSNSCLQQLTIKNCGSLSSFPSIKSLKLLDICKCGKLELPLPEDIRHNHHPSLECLWMDSSCDSLTSFPLSFFTNLGSLIIQFCTNLEVLSIPDSLQHLNLTALRTLEIFSCPKLESFPEGGLPTPNLKVLSIRFCKKLKSLPQRMHTLLRSLQNLNVDRCPEIVSFPEGGLPNKLSSLRIWICNKLMASRMDWDLQTLSSLREFEIGGGDEERSESFPEEWLLPSTLTFLSICNLPNLKSFNKEGLQRLSSLQRLEIRNCSKFKSFPTQGLPSSLSFLIIEECSLLKKHCRKDKGKEWPKIAHIPCVKIDGEIILS